MFAFDPSGRARRSAPGRRGRPVRGRTARYGARPHRIVRVDRTITRRDRSAHLTRNASAVLRASAIRMSLVAELEGRLAGYLMARVDFGDLGRTEATAVLDTIDVDPDLARRHVGRAFLEQLLMNLGRPALRPKPWLPSRA